MPCSDGSLQVGHLTVLIPDPAVFIFGDSFCSVPEMWTETAGGGDQFQVFGELLKAVVERVWVQVEILARSLADCVTSGRLLLFSKP